MTKLEFLKGWFETRGYRTKAAIQSVITIQLEHPDSSGRFKMEPDTVFIEDGKFHSIIGDETVVLEGDVTKPFAYMDDRFVFPNDFHPVLQGKGLESTFGLMLFNIILFWEPFGELVPYVNKAFTAKFITGLINRLMVDNPQPGESVPPGKASVDSCLKFSSNASFLEGLGSHYIKPGGIDSLTVDARVIKLRDQLFKENKDQLTDPVVFTEIVNRVVALDREIQMTGPSKNFFIDDKYINNARKRMFIAFGIEPNANEDGWVALTRSLDEGLDPKEMVAYINTAVSGAYGRAMATGDGGAKVKETIRLVGRQSIATEDGTENGPLIQDCGSEVGEFKILAPEDMDYWTGSYVITATGPELITEENASTFVNKPIRIRVPQYCLTQDSNFCVSCAGQKLGMYRNRLSAEVTRIPTEQMLVKMKANHIAGSSTVTLDLKSAIS